MKGTFSGHNMLQGIISSIVGGAFFSFFLVKSGMFVNFASMIGLQAADVGVLIHLGASVVFGIIYATIFCCMVRNIPMGIITGLIFGVGIWFVGPMTLMPFLASGAVLGSLWTPDAMLTNMDPLIGHLVYGFILGLCYGWMRKNCSG